MERNKRGLHALARIGTGCMALLGMTLAVSILGALADQNAFAQTIPRRIDMLQSVHPIQTSPMLRVDRLRADIIRATNPETGTVNVRILQKHPGTAEPDMHGTSTGHRILSKHPGSAEPGMDGTGAGHKIHRKRP